MFRKWGYLAFSLITAILLAIMAAKPPAPQNVDTALNQFSSARAMADVRIIASEHHPTGSPENVKTRAYLVDRLTELGMEVSISEAKLPERALARLNRWSGAAKTEQTMFNLIGVLPGEDRSKPALLLMAHHDTVWDSPGAADDTMGLASILEIVRAVNETGKQSRDLIILFTDAEELGLAGAKHFFKQHPLRSKIGAIINFEARGSGGTANMFQTSANNGSLAEIYAKAVKQPSASSLSAFVYNILPNDTDLTPALDGNYAAYNIAILGRAGQYHSPKNDADALDQGSLQHMGSQGLDLTRALLSSDPFPAEKPDVTFFDVFGFFTLVYAPYWGWVFLMAAAIFYALSVKGTLKPQKVFTGLLRMLGFLLIGGLLLYSFNFISGNDDAANYYDRLAAMSRLELVALFTCAALFLFLYGSKKLPESQRLGTALPIFLLAIIGQIYAPTAAYFLTLPLMLCGMATLAVKWNPKNAAGHLLAVIPSTLVIGYMIGLAHLLLLGVGQNMLPVAILPAAIAAIAISALFPGLKRKHLNLLAITGFVIAIGIALWVRLDPMASTVPLYAVW